MRLSELMSREKQLSARRLSNLFCSRQCTQAPTRIKYNTYLCRSEPDGLLGTHLSRPSEVASTAGLPILLVPGDSLPHAGCSKMAEQREQLRAT